MSRIRSNETAPEQLLRSELHHRGYRFRKNDKKLSGKPDIVLKKYRTVIFVNGCFWHQHQGCEKAVMPKSNIEYWEIKLQKNVDRDKTVYEKLKTEGWRVIVAWECEIKKDIDSLLSEIVSKLIM